MCEINQEISIVDDIYAIIPARSGSKGVKDKNIQCIKGYPLMAYSIAAAHLAGINRVIVSTDSEKYAQIAKKYGAEVPVLRPKEYAKDDSPDIDFMDFTLKWLINFEKQIPKLFLHLRPTTPLRKISYILEAIEKIKNNEEATSLRSVHKQTFPPSKMVCISDKGYYTCYDSKMTMEEVNNPRQCFCDVFVPDGYVDVIKSENVLKTHTMHGSRVLSYVIDEAVDIDNTKDMDYLIYLIDKNGSEILDYLQENYERSDG